MRYWLSRREDPHAVYNRILPHIEGLEKATVITRWGQNLTSPFYVVRILLAMAGDLLSMLKCCRSNGQFFVVREFSAWPWLMLAPVVRICKPNTKLYLNINHNLNNSLERKVILPALSKFFSIAFIEPSESVLETHPYLTAFRLMLQPATHTTNIKAVYLFLGTRSEQICVDDEQLTSVLREWPEGIEFLVCGGANHSRLAAEAFLAAFSAGALIAVLYQPETYSDRHSGVVLEALVSGCPVVMFRSTLAQAYVQRGFPVHIIDTVGQLPSVIRALQIGAITI
jgi:hypothetical protein